MMFRITPHKSASHRERIPFHGISLSTHPFCVLAAPAQSTAARAEVSITFFPRTMQPRVNPDTHLTLTFSSPPTLGKSG